MLHFSINTNQQRCRPQRAIIHANEKIIQCLARFSMFEPETGRCNFERIRHDMSSSKPRDAVPPPHEIYRRWRAAANTCEITNVYYVCVVWRDAHASVSTLRIHYLRCGRRAPCASSPVPRHKPKPTLKPHHFVPQTCVQTALPFLCCESEDKMKWLIHKSALQLCNQMYVSFSRLFYTDVVLWHLK